MTLVGLAALAALAAEPSGCADALARAARLPDAELAAAAPELARAAALAGAPSEAVEGEARRLHEGGGGGPPANRFRAALERHCALAAAPRLAAAAASDRERAREILDRPAFRRARADPWLVYRLARGLWQRLLDLFASSSDAKRYFLFSQVLFLAVAAVAVGFGAWALLRRRPSAGRAPVAPDAAVGTAPDARLDAAAAAAARGDAALAVRLALRAALGALERDAALPGAATARACTNAELVALLRGARPEQLEAARTLCGLHDRTAYGGRPAGPAEAAAALAAARALGASAGSEPRPEARA